MEIGKDAIMRMVRATRMAVEMSENIQKLCGNDNVNTADYLSNELIEALYDIVDGRRMNVNDQFMDKEAVKLVMDTELSESDAADGLLKLYEQIHPAMPKPNLVSRDKLNEMLGNCGYRPTAEREWSR